MSPYVRHFRRKLSSTLTQFEAFAARLMAILAELGIDPVSQKCSKFNIIKR
jgi:hypothetical protein